MHVIRTAIPDVLILEPKVFPDDRGFFFESFNARVFEEVTGVKTEFVQDNHSRSTKGVLRGLHYQIEQAQGKLVRVIGGDVFDVAVDLRKSSPTFKQSVGVRLTDENRRMFWVPPGFGHGFLVMSERVDFLYKTTAYYYKPGDRVLKWDDAEVGVEWPLAELGMAPILSVKDLGGKPLAEADMYA